MSLTWTPATDDDPEFTVTTATQHSVLAGRSTADAHPASAITTDNDWNGNLTSAGTNLAAVLDAIDDLALGGGGGAVDSVNGETGVVVLDAADVDADASGTAAALIASPVHPGGVPYRADLAGWQAKFEAATAAAPVDVVLITDSLWETATFGLSAAQMLHRQLNAAAGVYLADPIGTSTLPLPVHAQAGAGPTSATSTQGTASTTATGGQGSTLTDGQVLTHVATATGFCVVYRTEPGFGTMTIRDGAGGTVLASINCAAAATSGNMWTSAALSDASHTLHITSTGTTRVEMVMPTRETHVRVWPCGRAGATTDDYIDVPAQALDFIDKLDTAGTLGLVLVATGTNDDGEYATDIPALLAAIAAATTADVVLWLPYMNTGLTQPELDVSRATARTAGVPLIDASVVADQIGTIDGVHPVTQGRVVMASHVSAVLSGDPIGAALRLAGAVAAGRGSTSTQVQEAGLMMGGGDTYLARTAAAEISVGTGLGLLLGVPDGVVGLAVAQVTEGSDPAAAGANKVKVYAKNDGGRSRLYTRDDVGVRSVAFVDDISSGIPATIIDAAGDLIVGTAADTAARLAVGTSGQVLTSNGTTAAWATPGAGLMQSVSYTSGSIYGLLGSSNSVNYHPANAAGRWVGHPIWLPAGNYSGLSVLSTAAAVATWRLGIHNGTPDGATTLLHDCGTVDMNATPGSLLASSAFTVPTTGLYWVAVLVDAHTATPTVWSYRGSVADIPALPYLGARLGAATFVRSYFARYASGVTTGSMPGTAPTQLLIDQSPLIRAHAA